MNVSVNQGLQQMEINPEQEIGSLFALFAGNVKPTQKILKVIIDQAQLEILGATYQRDSDVVKRGWCMYAALLIVLSDDVLNYQNMRSLINLKFVIENSTTNAPAWFSQYNAYLQNLKQIFYDNKKNQNIVGLLQKAVLDMLGQGFDCNNKKQQDDILHNGVINEAWIKSKMNELANIQNTKEQVSWVNAEVNCFLHNAETLYSEVSFDDDENEDELEDDKTKINNCFVVYAVFLYCAGKLVDSDFKHKEFMEQLSKYEFYSAYDGFSDLCFAIESKLTYKNSKTMQGLKDAIEDHFVELFGSLNSQPDQKKANDNAHRPYAPAFDGDALDEIPSRLFSVFGQQMPNNSGQNNNAVNNNANKDQSQQPLPIISNNGNGAGPVSDNANNNNADRAGNKPEPYKGVFNFVRTFISRIRYRKSVFFCFAAIVGCYAGARYLKSAWRSA